MFHLSKLWMEYFVGINFKILIKINKYLNRPKYITPYAYREIFRDVGCLVPFDVLGNVFKILINWINVYQHELRTKKFTKLKR